MKKKKRSRKPIKHAPMTVERISKIDYSLFNVRNSFVSKFHPSETFDLIPISHLATSICIMLLHYFLTSCLMVRRCNLKIVYKSNL